MKKINHKADLYLEQKRMLEKEIALEKVIKKSWNEVKEFMLPRIMGKRILTNIARQIWANKTHSTGILTSSLGYAAAILSQRLLQRATEKLFNLFSKK